MVLIVDPSPALEAKLPYPMAARCGHAAEGGNESSFQCRANMQPF